jgi:hypothetical protein
MWPLHSVALQQHQCPTLCQQKPATWVKQAFWYYLLPTSLASPSLVRLPQRQQQLLLASSLV